MEIQDHLTKPCTQEYKVADDEEKTYISRNENRDGNELSGSYSFIDATGALVTVDYTAGVNGYAETRSKEAGKVQMKAVPGSANITLIKCSHCTAIPKLSII